MEKNALLFFLIFFLFGVFGKGLAAVEPGDQSTSSTTTTTTFLDDVGKLLRTIAVVGAVLMIVLGGLRWMTSLGDPTKISEAKDIIYKALLGLLIVVLAETIVALIGAR